MDSSSNYQKTNNSVISTESKPSYNELKISRFELMVNIIRNFFWIPNGDTPPPTLRGTLIISFLAFATGILLALFCCFFNFSIYNGYSCKAIPKPQIIFACGLLILPSLYVFWICFCCWRRIEGYDWWMIPQL